MSDNIKSTIDRLMAMDGVYSLSQIISIACSNKDELSIHVTEDSSGKLFKVDYAFEVNRFRLINRESNINRPITATILDEMYSLESITEKEECEGVFTSGKTNSDFMLDLEEQDVIRRVVVKHRSSDFRGEACCFPNRIRIYSLDPSVSNRDVCYVDFDDDYKIMSVE